jgi:ABC-type microcin C transport system duplicated ATPase subunit YejF
MVKLKMRKEKTLGLVGESGTARPPWGAVSADIQSEGHIWFDHREIASIPEKEFSRSVTKCRHLPGSTPVRSPADGHGIVGEPFKIHQMVESNRPRSRVDDLFRKVSQTPI